MSPKRKTKSTCPKRESRWSRLRQNLTGRGGKVAGVVLIVLAVAVGGTAAFSAMERYVKTTRQSAGPVRFSLKLTNLSDWMPASLARAILADLSPEGLRFEDPQLCRKVFDRVADNPWVRQVRQVRRVQTGPNRGEVRISADFRRPIARVQQDGKMFVIDAEGVVLPARQVPQWVGDVDGKTRYYLYRDGVPEGIRPARLHYIVIQGVQSPPPIDGQQWVADDLQAGLKLLKLVLTRPYANQVTVVDVRNYAQRISDAEPELRMWAQVGRSRPTDIRFGRFPQPAGGDWVISPARKMQYLDGYVEDQGGRLAGVHQYIDVRFDELRVSLN
jgi:hypothetical protein